MGALTKLQAVNRMLIRAGEYPVSTLSASVNDISLAVNILDDTTVQSLSASDKFLTLLAEYTPDIDGYITIPDETVAIRGAKQNRFENLSTRGRSPTLLYDMDDNTSVFTDSKWLEITVTMDFEDLPTKKQEYVADMAARTYQMLVHGDANVDAMLAQKEYMSRAEYIAQDARSRRSSYFRTQVDARKASNRDNYGGWFNGGIW